MIDVLSDSLAAEGGRECCGEGWCGPFRQSVLSCLWLMLPMSRRTGELVKYTGIYVLGAFSIAGYLQSMCMFHQLNFKQLKLSG